MKAPRARPILGDRFLHWKKYRTDCYSATHSKKSVSIGVWYSRYSTLVREEKSVASGHPKQNKKMNETGSEQRLYMYVCVWQNFDLNLIALDLGNLLGQYAEIV